MSAAVIPLRGDITFASANEILQKARGKVLESDVVLDFSDVQKSDSVALAILLEWLRAARQTGHSITVQNMPDGLTSLAQMYGVSELIPTTAA